MNANGKPPAPNAGRTPPPRGDLARRRRARNWALLAVLLALAALFYAITLVKLTKTG